MTYISTWIVAGTALMKSVVCKNLDCEAAQTSGPSHSIPSPSKCALHSEEVANGDVAKSISRSEVVMQELTSDSNGSRPRRSIKSRSEQQSDRSVRILLAQHTLRRHIYDLLCETYEIDGVVGVVQ